MEFSILGPIEVRPDGRAVAIGGVKPRGLLAVLLLHANEPVSAERLALALWGEDASGGAVKTVQVHVSRLRRALGDPDLLITTPAGYRLRVRPGELDAERFEQRVADGRGALAAGELEQAAAVLREALELWRGPPLADVAALPFASAVITRLEEQRVAAVELRVEADLATGRHAELIGELQQLTSEHPWRERLHAQLMLALYRSGRQADALQEYGHAREVLIEQLGLEPGAELADLQRSILAREPILGGPSATFTPLRSGRRSTLPAAPNRTIGRDRELAAVGERLRASPVRLLTLTGPGGVGKTRLALEAARAVEADFADGARFVSLAAVQRPEDVPAAIAGALGVILLAGESASQAAERFLAAKDVLLVADNFEHVLGAAPFIGALLGACPALTVLATSREPLALRAEERYPVPPLPLPGLGTPEGNTETLAGEDAVTLFVERARAHDPAFDLSDGTAAAVVEICRRVDGLPLAIELAAARCGLLSPAEIAERLEVALGAPGAAARDAPARHHTLRATVDWSHQLLSDGEKACFARFAVFAGGATVEAAETIAGADLDTLDHLVGKSLLVRRRQAHTPTRLQMLETIRAYAAERFAAADDLDAVRERHYRHFLAVAERHGTDQALMGVRGKEHLRRLDEEIHNFDAALAWAVGRPDAGPALAMVAALGSFWDLRDRYADAVEWIDRSLAVPGAQDHPAEHARALLAKAVALRWRGRVAEQPAILAEAQAVARAVGDPLLLAKVLNRGSAMWAVAGRSDTADTLAHEALRSATAAGDEWEIAQAWAGKASAVSNLPELRERVDRAASRLEDVGNVVRLGQLYCDAAYGALAMGGDRDARMLADRAAPFVRDLDSPGTWMILRGNIGLAALLIGDTTAAHGAFREELELCRQLVALPLAAEGLLGLAAVAVVHGDLSHAARLRGAAAAHRHGLQQDAVEARLEAVFFASARMRHGADAWDTLVREGAQLSFEDAIAYALDQQRAQSAHATSTT